MEMETYVVKDSMEYSLDCLQVKTELVFFLWSAMYNNYTVENCRTSSIAVQQGKTGN